VSKSTDNAIGHGDYQNLDLPVGWMLDISMDQLFELVWTGEEEIPSPRVWWTRKSEKRKNPRDMYVDGESSILWLGNRRAERHTHTDSITWTKYPGNIFLQSRKTGPESSMVSTTLRRCLHGQYPNKRDLKCFRLSPVKKINSPKEVGSG